MNNGPSSYTQPCFGMVCPIHAECLRYRAVDGMPGHYVAIASCATSSGTRPLFTPAPAGALEIPA